MTNYPEPSIEMTADAVEAAAQALHDGWQQPPTDLVLPPPGVWSKLGVARDNYAEAPMDRVELQAAFSHNFDAKVYRGNGDMTTATANALEVAYKSCLFGRGENLSIDVFTAEGADGKRQLLITGTIYGMPAARTFEIAREGDWSYDDLVARNMAPNGSKTPGSAPTKSNRKRHSILWVSIYWVLVGLLFLFGIGALVMKLILAVALFFVVGLILFFMSLYSS